jgi:FAD:protein FMN transferase
MIKKILTACLCVLLITPLAGCSKKDEPANDQVVEKNALKMDTVVKLKVYGPKANQAIEAAFKRIDEIEQMASATISTSDVSKINNSAGKEYVKVHPEIIKLIKFAEKYSEITNGAFDITIGPLIKLWGIGTENARVPSDSEIKSKLALVGYKNISINDKDNSVKLKKEGMSIDLGGIAKGFTADEVIKVLKKYDINTALINLGGSTIYTLGQKPDGSLWSVGVQHPRKGRDQGYVGIIKMPQEALSTSGDYERYFIKDDKRYHHILSTDTGYPADAGVISDTIIIDSNIPDCNMLADLLTKVTFVSGVDKGFKIIDSLEGVTSMAVTSDYKVYKSAAWKNQVDSLSADFTIVK